MRRTPDECGADLYRGRGRCREVTAIGVGCSSRRMTMTASLPKPTCDIRSWISQPRRAIVAWDCTMIQHAAWMIPCRNSSPAGRVPVARIARVSLGAHTTGAQGTISQEPSLLRIVTASVCLRCFRRGRASSWPIQARHLRQSQRLRLRRTSETAAASASERRILAGMRRQAWEGGLCLALSLPVRLSSTRQTGPES